MGGGQADGKQEKDQAKDTDALSRSPGQSHKVRNSRPVTRRKCVGSGLKDLPARTRGPKLLPWMGFEVAILGIVVWGFLFWGGNKIRDEGTPALRGALDTWDVLLGAMMVLVGLSLVRVGDR